MSQLLERLRRELSNESNPVKRGQLIAQIAAALARLGRFEEAKQCVADVRSQFGGGQSGAVTIWTMLSEGIIFHYEALSPAAIDRLKGAQALAIAMRYAEGIAATAAWKAHIEFELSMFDDMATSLDLALDNVVDTDLDVKTRLAMILSNAYMVCGDRDTAQDWFLRGREMAVKNGDKASIEALLYNRTVFGLSYLRVRRALGQPVVIDLPMLRGEIDSAKSLQSLSTVNALTNHIFLWSARLMIVAEQFEAAISELESVRSLAPFATHNFSQSLIDLEIAYCHMRLGQSDLARERYLSLDLSDLPSIDLDEQIVCTRLRLHLCSLPGCGEAASYQEKLEELSCRFEDEGKHLLGALGRLHAVEKFTKAK